MKVLLFTDVHADEQCLKIILEKSKECDIMICCGDISVFGMGLAESLETLKQSGKPLYITHGNHEHISELKALCDGKQIIFVHKEMFTVEDIMIFAYGGGGFSERDERLDKWVKEVQNNIHGKTVFVTHAPPYDTTLDFIPHLGHRGSRSVKETIELLKPTLFACGHFHETFGVVEEFNGTKMINPGDEGMIVEL